MPWAISVPDDDEHSIYVWLDALSNYITAAGLTVDPNPDNEAFDVSRGRTRWPPTCQIMEKIS